MLFFILSVLFLFSGNACGSENDDSMGQPIYSQKKERDNTPLFILIPKKISEDNYLFKLNGNSLGTPSIIRGENDHTYVRRQDGVYVDLNIVWKR